MRPENAEFPAFASTKSERSLYLVSPFYDWAFFLLPVVVSLALGALISGTRFSQEKFYLGDYKATLAGLSIGILIHAHLVAVFFRSHANPSIFKLYPLRFLLVPFALYVAMVFSTWVLISVTVLVVFWDIYHSALQTFGLARIYDRNRGNDPSLGRRLDMWLNHLLYAGPIVAGATMFAHVKQFEKFDEVEATFFTSIPAFMETNQRYFTWAVLIGGTLFLVYYVLAYVRFYRRGYKVSFLKVYLLASTGLCSIYTWGFNTWGEAFFIMNLFHALQYLGLVWWSESKHIKKSLRVDNLRGGKLIALGLFLGSVLAYGYWAEVMANDIEWMWCITQVVAVMHFWYDGFIWSVTRKQV